MFEKKKIMEPTKKVALLTLNFKKKSKARQHKKKK